MKINQNVKRCFIVLVAVTTLLEETKAFSGDVMFSNDWRGNYGSCGLERSKHNHFYVAAVSKMYMNPSPGETNQNNLPKCGDSHCLQIWGPHGSAVLKISDTCEDCRENDIIVADSVFPMLGDPKKGRVRMNWNFVDCRSNRPGPWSAYGK